MRTRLFIITLMVLLLMVSCKKERMKIPFQENKYTHIYSPKVDIFPGPSTSELKAGVFYTDWVPNDHTFVKAKDGKWHLFGITHPLTSTQNVHEGEFMAFHAISKAEDPHSDFIDLPKVLTPDQREGERLELYAPYIIQKDGLYYMIYSPEPMRFAISRDLKNWKPQGVLFREEKGARDPNLFFYNGKYYMIYCTEKSIGMRTSIDLINWSSSQIIFTAYDFEPESPTMVMKDGAFYLFVCGWNGVWDKKEVQGAYQHRTYVYFSRRVNEFQRAVPITILNAHAPEIFQVDEQWYISSAEWPNRGVSIDKLNWK
ncbi:hypothetical protein EMN47_11115 [Prolixibacteraceae bacterium JC049]|nr:hypothetical protein [Prolixibacteraceae bacterium JC049]